MVEGINTSLPLQAVNANGLQTPANLDKVDFHGNLRKVFEDVTSRLQEVPGMQGVYCVASPVSQLDITVVDPQTIV